VGDRGWGGVGDGTRDEVIKLGCWMPVSNFLVDQVMQRLNGSQFKVLMCLWRQTVGRNRAKDCLALSQIQAMTWLASRRRVVVSLRFLLDAGLIEPAERTRDGNAYRMVWNCPPEVVIERLESLVTKANQLRKRTNGGSIREPALVRKGNTQEESRNIEKESEPPPFRVDWEKVRANMAARQPTLLRQRLAQLGLESRRQEPPG